METFLDRVRETDERERRSTRYGRRPITANAISLLRMPLAVAFVLAGATAARLVITVIAAASDVFDGFVARRWAQVTRAGEILDPVGDRVFIVAALVTLAVEGRFPLWALPLMLVRDIGVTIGAVLMLERNPQIRMPARRPGKRVTVVQLAGTILILLYPVVAPLIAVALAAMGAIALRDYFAATSSAAAAERGRPIASGGSV